jgi:hypothetical protein
MSMVAPLGALPVGPAVSTTEVEEGIDGGGPGALLAGLTTSTTEVEEDVDNGPVGGHCQQVR